MQDFPTGSVPLLSPEEDEAEPIQVSNERSDPPLSPWPSRSQVKRRFNKLLAVLLIVGALLIAGGGFLSVLLNPGSSISSLIVHSQSATATNPPGSANQHSAPRDISSNQVGSISTQQPALSPTPASTSPVDATKLSPQQLYTTITSRPPAYSSGMSTQDSAQWDQSSGCSFANSAYAVSTPLLGNNIICLANALSVTDFALQASITIRSGSNSDGGGLVFRDAGGTDYLFGIGLDGSYNLSGTSVNGTSSALHTGLDQTNILTVIAQGNLIFLYANGQLLAQANDAASSHGQIGLMATSSLLSVNVTFANVELWML